MIYLTQQKKEELEAKIAEIEKQIEYNREYASVFFALSGRNLMLKEILSEAIVLPIEEDWENVDFIHDYSQPQLSQFYPNGVIIKPETK